MNDLIRRADAIALASGGCHPANLAEEIAKLLSAQPDVPDINDGDMISRQAAIDALTDENIINHMDSAGDGDLHRCKRAMQRILAQLPTAPRQVDEWCVDCSEYDSEKHCCPRFNRVIRSAVDERKRGRWIDLRQEGDSRFMCSACKWKEHVPTCMGEPTVWEYCPNCGARMDGRREDGDNDG